MIKKNLILLHNPDLFFTDLQNKARLSGTL